MGEAPPCGGAAHALGERDGTDVAEAPPARAGGRENFHAHACRSAISRVTWGPGSFGIAQESGFGAASRAERIFFALRFTE